MDKEKSKLLIDELVEKLKKWEYEYYALEQPTISDYEYDICLQQLMELESNFPEFIRKDSPTNRVGGYVSTKFNKAKHSIPMLSLSNAFNKGDLLKFDNDIKKELNINDVSYMVEPKIDGLSISLIYNDGYLQQALTRGDGVVGEDVTENVKTIKSIPLSIKYKGLIEIRGEIFIDKVTFEKINSESVKKFANARNAASGSLRNLDSKITASRNLKAYLYNIPNVDRLNLFSQNDVIDWLKDNNFQVAKQIKHCNNIDEVFNQIDYLTVERLNFSYDIDGIVIKVNNINYYDELGYTSKFPKWAIAYKFGATIKSSKLLSIETTVGRTGRINFVANLEPIEIDGSIISKATLHNAEYIVEKDIRINDYVNLYKAGDIIPKIISGILEKRSNDSYEWIPPKKCPSCNSKLIKISGEVDQYCLNENCIEKQIQQIIHFCSRNAMNIEGISEMIIRKLFDNKIINNFTDLYLLEQKKEEILALDILIKDKSFNNIINSINKSKNNSIERLIFGLGIRHIGLTASKLLSKRFKNINAIMNLTYEQLNELNEFGDKMSQSVIEWFSNDINKSLIKKLIENNINIEFIDEFKDVKIDQNKQIFINKNFVITGSFSIDRNKIKNILESLYQSKVLSTVTKKVDYLIIGKNYTQSKYDKAQLLGIKIIDYAFWE